MSETTWVITTDGRGEFLDQCIGTWEQASGTFCAKVILDDSGDHAYRQSLVEKYGDEWEVVSVGETRMGYVAAMREIRSIGIRSDAKFIFHLEDDFQLNRPVNIDSITELLDSNRNIAQMALVRQPWYANEIVHGGVIQALIEQGCRFQEKIKIDKDKKVVRWLEHRAVWTANPNVFSVEVARMDYPDVPYSESAFMRQLNTNTALVCAYWGTLSDEPYVTHIGDYRNGHSY